MLSVSILTRLRPVKLRRGRSRKDAQSIPHAKVRVVNDSPPQFTDCVTVAVLRTRASSYEDRPLRPAGIETMIVIPAVLHAGERIGRPALPRQEEADSIDFRTLRM